jgi:hypothetical protein
MARSRGLAACVAVVAGVAALTCVLVAPAQAASSLATKADQTYQANGRVAAILAVGNTIYLAGSFTSVRPYGDPAGTGEVPRSYLAAVDRVSGQLLPWNPGANKEAYALAASPDGSTIYVGGLFSKVAGQPRLKVAAFSASTGNLTSWAPVVNNKVLAIAVTSSRVFLGGTFTTVNTAARSYLASVDTAGVLDTTWQPAPDNRVRALLASSDGSTIYAGGDFVSVNGDPKQKHFVSLTATTATINTWSYHPGWPVYALTADTTRLYLGGNGSGGHAGAASLAGGTMAWTLQTDGGIQAASLIAGVLYLGGHFDNICEPVGMLPPPTSGFKCPQYVTTRHKLLAVDPGTGTLDPWNPGADSPLGVFALGNAGGSLQVGGDFTKLGNPDALGQATWAQQSYGQFS